MASTQEPPHGPFPPQSASLGGTPSKSVDVPIASVFLVIFIGSAALHMTIFQLNNRRGHKFIMSGAMFGFSMARIMSMIMRIVWACYPHNVRVAIAASVFAAAGVLILYFVNILFSQRLLRAAHPSVGWHPSLKWVFMVLYISVPVILAMIITVVVQSFYTLNPNTHRIDHDVQVAAQAYLLFLAALPILIVTPTLLVPRSNNRRIDKFGSGSWHTKAIVLLCASCLLVLGRAFVATSTFVEPRPARRPAWFDSKAVFWIFYFTVEAIVIYSYAIVRVDRRFHVPDGSSGPGDYSTEKVGGSLAGAGDGKASTDHTSTSGSPPRLDHVRLSEEGRLSRAERPRGPHADDGAEDSGVESDEEEERKEDKKR